MQKPCAPLPAADKRSHTPNALDATLDTAPQAQTPQYMSPPPQPHQRQSPCGHPTAPSRRSNVSACLGEDERLHKEYMFQRRARPSCSNTRDALPRHLQISGGRKHDATLNNMVRDQRKKQPADQSATAHHAFRGPIARSTQWMGRRSNLEAPASICERRNVLC
eukprot:scaffold20734_cov118-Isochrysis_galbana.AAC.3